MSLPLPPPPQRPAEVMAPATSFTHPPHPPAEGTVGSGVPPSPLPQPYHSPERAVAPCSYNKIDPLRSYHKIDPLPLLPLRGASSSELASTLRSVRSKPQRSSSASTSALPSLWSQPLSAMPHPTALLPLKVTARMRPSIMIPAKVMLLPTLWSFSMIASLNLKPHLLFTCKLLLPLELPFSLPWYELPWPRHRIRPHSTWSLAKH